MAGEVARMHRRWYNRSTVGLTQEGKAVPTDPTDHDYDYDSDNEYVDVNVF